MHGPHPPGTFAERPVTAWERGLARGARYRVIRGFVDHDGRAHPVGETWRFVSSNFSPHEDGLSVFVALDDGTEWHFRLRWREEEQGAICERFGDFVEAC